MSTYKHGALEHFTVKSSDAFGAVEFFFFLLFLVSCQS